MKKKLLQSAGIWKWRTFYRRRSSEEILGLLIMIKISLMRLQRVWFISGICPGKSDLSPKKGLFAYAFAGRDITGKIHRRYSV